MVFDLLIYGNLEKLLSLGSADTLHSFWHSPDVWLAKRGCVWTTRIEVAYIDPNEG